jgi:hypothetical protein
MNVKFKVAIAELFPRIPWELLAVPLGYAKHKLGTAALEKFNRICLGNLLWFSGLGRSVVLDMNNDVS